MYYEGVVLNLIEKYKHLHDDKRMYVRSNDVKILENVVNRPQISPAAHAKYLHLEYERVINVLRYYGLNSRELQIIMEKELNEFISLLKERLNTRQTIETNIEWEKNIKDIFNRLRNERVQLTRGFYLMALIKFCSDNTYRELFPFKQIWIRKLSAVEATNFFRELEYEINCQEKGLDITDLNKMIDDSVLEDGLRVDTDETIEDRIQSLEFELQTTRSTLKFLKKSLDDIVANINSRSEAAKEEAINEFFIQLNSERYGRLLDNAFIVEKKMEELRKNRYKFPLEVMTLPIIVRNFTNFIKANGFIPIEEVGRQFVAGADDLIYMVYEGEPFNGDELKTVEVINSGWMKNNVIISKPVVREI